ncbi:MAG: hypothetical protein QOI42_1856 [Frankiaceae bacterium]|nr:hypothetical protein [Frankiaceae bacterium]
MASTSCSKRPADPPLKSRPVAEDERVGEDELQPGGVEVAHLDRPGPESVRQVEDRAGFAVQPSFATDETVRTRRPVHRGGGGATSSASQRVAP